MQIMIKVAIMPRLNAGAKTIDMSALRHDRRLGNISHLEHFGVAFLLTEMMAIDRGKNNSQHYRDYGSLTLDITRRANASSPVWDAWLHIDRHELLAAIKSPKKSRMRESIACSMATRIYGVEPRI